MTRYTPARDKTRPFQLWNGTFHSFGSAAIVPPQGSTGDAGYPLTSTAVAQAYFYDLHVPNASGTLGGSAANPYTSATMIVMRAVRTVVACVGYLLIGPVATGGAASDSQEGSTYTYAIGPAGDLRYGDVAGTTGNGCLTGGGTQIMVIEHPRLLAHLARAYPARLAQGFDGMLTDVSGTFPATSAVPQMWNGFTQSATKGFSNTGAAVPASAKDTPAQWLRMVRNLLAGLRSVVNAAGGSMWANGLGNGTSFYGGGTYSSGNDATSAIGDGLDGAMMEDFLRTATATATSWPTESVWQQNVNSLIDSEIRDRPVIAETKFWPSGITAANALGTYIPLSKQWHQYSAASFLLATDGLHKWGFRHDSHTATATSGTDGDGSGTDMLGGHAQFGRNYYADADVWWTRVNVGSVTNSLRSYLTATAATASSGTATFTVGTHDYFVGGIIQPAGFTPSIYNGRRTVTAITSTTVSVALGSTPTSATVLGTITGSGNGVISNHALAGKQGAGHYVRLFATGAAAVNPTAAAITSATITGLLPSHTYTAMDGTTYTSDGSGTITVSSFGANTGLVLSA